MKPIKENKWLDQIFSEVIGKDKPIPDFAQWCREHPHSVQTLKSCNLRPSTGSSKKVMTTFQIWRIIMKNKITKFASVAAIVLVIAMFTIFLDSIITPVYAIGQTIEASHFMRYVHLRYFDSHHEEDVAKECWLAFDNAGCPINIRINWASWFGNGDIVVWNEKESKIWSIRHNLLTAFNDEIYTNRMVDMANRENPGLCVERLQDREARGEVKIEIEEPANKSEPIIVTATGIGKYTKRFVLFVDQATKLVTYLKWYELEDGVYKYQGVMEYLDYNVPIDAKMFSLDGELPTSVKYVDTKTQDVGLAQENLTVENIGKKVVGEFLDSVIAKDYVKAGKLGGGLEADDIKKQWEGQKMVRVISIDKVSPGSKLSALYPNAQQIDCTIEVENGDTTKQLSKSFTVWSVLGRRDRWIIKID